MNKSNLATAIIIAFVFACGTTKVLPPTQADADRGAKKYPGLMLTELQRGKLLYEQNCGQCHGLKHPAAESEKKWQRIVPIMVQKVNKKAGREALNNYSQDLILKYVITMREAREPKK